MIGLILLILFFLYKDLVKAIVLTIVFVPLAVLSTKFGKIIPHMTPETVTASAIMMGYLFGGKIGFLFGLFVGLYAYTKNSCINLNFLTLIIMSACCGVLASFLESRGMNFLWAFGTTIVIRNAVGLPLYMFVIFPAPAENIMQHAFHALFNLAILMPLFFAIFNLMTIF